MSPLALDPGERAEHERLSPYLRASLEGAARTADRLHAEEVALEHLLLVLLEDEDCGAHQLVLHAFADPDTIRAEVLALAPGILVVGSSRSLPFSSAGVRALFGARRRSAGAVDPAGLLLSAAAELEDDLVASLREIGLDADVPRDPAPDGPEDAAVFGAFGPEALRALGAAARAAEGFRRDAVAPAHLVLGCLERAPGREIHGLRLAPARMRLGGRDEDAARPPERALAPDEGLRAFVRGLPAGAGTGHALHAIAAGAAEELRLLLVQQRITEELTRTGATAFPDPGTP